MHQCRQGDRDKARDSKGGVGQQAWLDEDQCDTPQTHRRAGDGRGSTRTQDVIVALDSDRTFEQGHGEDFGFFLH
jgi:hypothetical protein